MTAIPPSMPLSTANWHWKNKNVTAWAKGWFQRELITIKVSAGEGGEGEEEERVEIVEVVEMDGDVELGQRKSKLITIYDCRVSLKWTGIAKDGTPVEGTLTIPEVSHEITLDGLSDYVYNFTLKTSSSPPVNSVYALAKSRLPSALESKFAEFPNALIETHGKDLTISTQASRTGTPAPSSASGTATPAGGNATTPCAAKTGGVTTALQGQKKEKEKEKLNTTVVKVEATFMASADDLFGLMTDEKRIPSWTRAPAQSSAKPGTEYSLFGGGVKGTYVSLLPPKEVKQTWSLQSPTWPSGHFATLTTTFEQSTDHTTVIWALDGVPLGSQEEISRNLQGYYVHGLKSIGYVQISLTPPSISIAGKSKSSSSPPPSSSSSRERRYVAIGFAFLALAAAFSIPLFYSS